MLRCLLATPFLLARGSLHHLLAWGSGRLGWRRTLRCGHASTQTNRQRSAVSYPRVVVHPCARPAEKTHFQLRTPPWPCRLSPANLTQINLSTHPPTFPRPPTIFRLPRSVGDYLQRIHTYSKASDSSFVLALIYMDRLLLSKPGLEANSLTVHRLFLGAILCAVKYHDDYHPTNKHYASVGGISVAELNGLELEVCR